MINVLSIFSIKFMIFNPNFYIYKTRNKLAFLSNVNNIVTLSSLISLRFIRIVLGIFITT